MKTIKSFMATWALCLILVLIISCEPVKEKAQQQELSSEEYTDLRHAIIDFMECEECVDGEKEKLLKFGDKATPTLVAILNEGPAPAKTALYEKQLRKTYEELQQYAATHPESKPASTEDEYVAMYLDNYNALYRMRSASALKQIGSEDAMKALKEAAAKKENRNDVKEYIEMMLK